MINAMEVREDDDNFKNPVDLLFDALEDKDKYKSLIKEKGLVVSALCGDMGGYGFEIDKDNAERIRKTKQIIDLAVEFGAVALVGKLGDMNVASMFVAAKMFDRRAEE